tara:strand:+ start:795 stop:1067 length:273 start_codon:yes stop_codon:yes gene_type:complete
MGFGKKDIIKNISSKALFTSKSSTLVLEAFLNFIKQNKRHRIKISKFGTFYLHKSPARIGRNPKTKEEFKIPASEKLTFKASNKVKSILN